MATEIQIAQNIWIIDTIQIPQAKSPQQKQLRDGLRERVGINILSYLNPEKCCYYSIFPDFVILLATNWLHLELFM
jgi:hypothetical protein